jgi:hypothetical protein
MTVIELAKDNELKQTDIFHISEFIVSFIEIKPSAKKEKTISAKEAILDSLADMLEKMLTLNTNLSKQNKIEIIHLLNKLKVNKEYMQLIKSGSEIDEDRLSDLQAASSRLFKKSQSAFHSD